MSTKELKDAIQQRLDDVPPNSVVVGNPGRVISRG